MSGLWLDHLFFGSGYGMASPFNNARYYWLVDTSRKSRPGKLYTWIGGFGAQLGSFEWFTPRPGSERRLFDHTFRPFNARRQWLRVECSWVVAETHDTPERLAALRQDLERA